MSDKSALFLAGALRVADFCAANAITLPTIESHNGPWGYKACAYYRPEPTGIQINLPMCAGKGYVGRQWSWPGYVVDRTPFGVLCHELGHCADVLCGRPIGIDYASDYSIKMRAAVREDPITTYCPNDAEWFAEIFRLYVTNPALLKAIRPRAFSAMMADFYFVERRDWPEVLADAPERTRNAARNKIDQAVRRGR